jgi:hypothetical protein
LCRQRNRRISSVVLKGARIGVVAGVSLACSAHFPDTVMTRTLSRSDPVVPSVQSPTGGNIANAAQVVSSMRPGFRHCYQRALNNHGRFSASVRLSLRVDAGGRIASVTGRGTNAPREMIECFFVEVGRHMFEPPAGGAAIVNVPVNLMAR